MESPTVIPLDPGRFLRLREYLPNTGIILWCLTDQDGRHIRWLDGYENQFVKCAISHCLRGINSENVDVSESSEVQRDLFPG